MSLAMSTALSALTVAQRLAEISSHNIANANTPGYSRQVGVLRPSLPVRTTAGMMGTGVTIDSILAIRDHYLNVRLNAQNTGLGKAEAQSRALSELETVIMPGPDTGMGFAINDFFKSVNELSINAQSSVARESVRQSAITLAETFRATNNQLRLLQLHVKAEYDESINQVNSYFEEIADLNGRIMSVSLDTDTANDLVDQRDLMIEKLSKYLVVNTSTQQGVTNVQFEGRLMVSGTEYMQLASESSAGRLKLQVEATSDVFDTPYGMFGAQTELYNETIPRYIEYVGELASSLIREFNAVHATGVGLKNGFTSLTSAAELADLDIDGTVGNEPLAQQAIAFPPTAGKLYITVTNQSTEEVQRSSIDYDPAVDSVLDIADKIAAIPYMNASVSSGYLTITSWPGYRFDFSNKLLPDGGSVGASQLSVSGAYTGSTDRSFTFYPMSTGTIGQTDDLNVAVIDEKGSFLGLLDVGSGYAPGNPVQVADGVKVSFSAGAVQAAQILTATGPFALADGDQLTVSLDGQAPVAITFNAADFSDITQATPDEVTRAINNADVGVKATIVGNAIMIYPAAAGPNSSIQAGGAAAATLGLSTALTTTDSQTIDVLGETDAGGLLTALGINSFFEGKDGSDISVSALVQADPANIAAAKSSPPGDNANAIKLAQIKSIRIANNNSQTLNEFFSGIVGKAGIDAAQAMRSEDTQMKLVENLERQRDSIAGVSLEEEMATLMRNQQAYFAAVKLISTIDEMLASLTRM